MLGAAAACARLLGLDAARTTMALGIAASQPIGVREQFGSMTKPFHPGGAARAGLTSALMATHGYTASARALEAPRGLLQTYSAKCDWHEITDELGERFEIAFNTYKPFACGIVIHPSIDGCVQLRNAHDLRADDIERDRTARAFAGARADRQEGAAHRARGQVQRVSRLRGRDPLRAGRRGRVLRRGRHAARRDRAARSRRATRRRRRSTRRRPTSRSRCSDGRTLHTCSSSTRSAACSGR